MTTEYPPKVKDLNYVDLDATAVTLTWARPQTAILAPIKTYVIKIFKKQSPDDSRSEVVPGTKASFTVTGLEPKTTYSFNIYAINKAGKGAVSHFPDVDTLVATIPTGNITCLSLIHI